MQQVQGKGTQLTQLMQRMQRKNSTVSISLRFSRCVSEQWLLSSQIWNRNRAQLPPVLG